VAARGVALVAAVVLLAGCAGPRAAHPATAPPRAAWAGGQAGALKAICVAALPQEVVVSAARGTVAGVRSLTMGPIFQALIPDAFPAAAPGAPVTWCWTRNSAASFTAWVVGPHRTTAVKVVTVNGEWRRLPSGPPILL
jgi:hypothetical protein